METEYLRQFALLAKECHFQTAADLLYISQSTLSKHIAALEKELGEPLFYRTTRQVSLTPFREKMLPYAEKIIGIVNACESELLSKNRLEAPGLHVGVSPFVSISRLMAAKMYCEGLSPELGNMVFTETASLQLREGLRKGRFQMVIDGSGPEWEQEDFASVPYITDHLCALLHEDQPLAFRESVSLHELEGLPYVHLYNEGQTSPLLCEPVLVCDTVPQTLGRVSEGMGYTILPFGRIKRHLPANVRAVRLIPSPELRFHVYYLRQAVRSDMMKEMLIYFAKSP